MYYVYVIQSTVRKYIYVGMTSDTKRRFAEHNYGKEKTTRACRPFLLVHQEVFETRIEARAREKYLKSGTGKEFLKTII